MELSSSSGVPPGFRFHPTDEELLLYYLKKKVSFEKFDLDVIREVDLNKIEPWDLQERCKIGSTPQNEWYFFSHKDRKYPTGSRTNRATNAGFWKATGRDKCIRTSYRKIGMRKTLVFYRGRAPHGRKTDWIMHEYRLEESDNDTQINEDGWVVCRVFKKKCFFKVGGTQEENGATELATELNYKSTATTDVGLHALSSHQYMRDQHQHLLHHYHQPAELSLQYQQVPLPAQNPYCHVQVQDLLPNHRANGYDFSVLQASCEAGLEVDACDQIQQVGEGRGNHVQNDWSLHDNIDGRFGNAGGAAAVQPANHISQQQRGGEIDLWGYGK